MRYLEAYNVFSGILWLCVLIRALVLYVLTGPEFVCEGMGDFVTWVQSLALLEVVHALLGLVRTPVTTTLMQVASRIVLVWGIVQPFPHVANVTAFTTMVVAWGITETVRYPYYYFALNNRIPRFLEWLRYNTFIVLYPLGASSEAILIFRALPDAQLVSPWYNLFLKGLLLIYPPSFYVLYTHMWRQRAKFMKKDQIRKVK